MGQGAALYTRNICRVSREAIVLDGVMKGQPGEVAKTGNLPRPISATVGSIHGAMNFWWAIGGKQGAIGKGKEPISIPRTEYLDYQAVETHRWPMELSPGLLASPTRLAVSHDRGSDIANAGRSMMRHEAVEKGKRGNAGRRRARTETES